MANMELKMLIFAITIKKESSMSIQISRVHDLIKDSLDFRAARQDMIASNIANADTPFYRPRDISFQDTLLAKKATAFNEKSTQLGLTQTNASHIPLQNEKSSAKPTLFFRDGHMARNDGNSVDLDVETTEMSKNAVMFKALIEANKKDSNIFKSVIDASSKTS
jgi:flagellar basal-body rod protein FlgB